MLKQFIPRRTDRRFIPLSFAQERLWFLNQLEPESSAYNLALALRLEGTLDTGALRSALDAIVERHEVLRTTYVVGEGRDPIQQIGPPRAVDLAIIDLTECPQSGRDGVVQRTIADLTERLFDLRRDQMLRAGLLRLELNHHVMVVVIHHIASDGWSSGILWRELAVFYKAFLEIKSVSLPELPIQYADYAAWQREWLSGTILASQLDYWKKQLQNLPTLQLPTDRPRPAIRSYRGGRRTFRLSRELIQGIKRLSRNEGVTLFMTLLAAFQTLLFRYSGQQDICTGSPIANRNYVEIEGLIGFFVNTLVLRTDLSGNLTFRELLSKVKRTALQCYAHQDLQFEKLVEELQPERNLGVSPLFQVMFTLHNYPRSGFTAPELVVSPIDIHQSAAKFDLSLALTETTDGLEGQLEYSTDLFDPTTVSRMVGHFQNLLESIVTNPEERISKLPLLNEAEKHQLLMEWNDTKRDYPSDKCVHQLFEEQVERAPRATAVVFEEQQLTYRELNTRANQLAHYLRRFGVGPEVLVGICVERSIEMVVGLLAILKAGGAYVPIDADFPPQRIEFMLQDSQATILLTQAGFDDLTASFTGARIALDRDWHEIARESADNFGSQQDPEKLAYVIYTSGSTGEPKGVMIQHNSVANFVASMAREPGLTETDILLAVTTLSFDIAGLEIYLPLTVGARVVLARREVAVDSVRLAKLVSDSGATVMQATPATWRMLLASGWQGNRKLKILCGGEALSDDVAEQLVSCSASLWNMYGPTETTIWSAVHRIPASPGRIVLGRPIANTQIYILDRNLQSVPIGVAGELHIAGAGVGRGYLKRAELTREKFIANPFSANAASRLYKTGDRARYLADGNIEFMGRMDNQVKIRGYRIELGEIEAVLGQHPGVQSSVVVVREDTPGDKRLVAYVVAPSDISTHELRSFLKQKLAEFMVPSTFAKLESLPLTPNGKVDRKALSELAPSGPELGETYLSPRTPTEELLADIWAEVLKLEKVGIQDNFFDLGGHSLLATRVVSKIREVFWIELPLRALFEKPTVVSLSDHIMSIRWARDDKPVLREDIDQTEEIIL